MINGKAVCKRFSTLQSEDFAYWDEHRKEVMDYVMPHRRRAGERISQGRRRTTKIYDATAVSAASRGAGKLKRAITPDFDQWFVLQPGPLVTDANQKRTLKELLTSASDLAWQVFNNGSFSPAADEMYLDLYAGDGAMLVLPGDDIESIVDFVSLPSEAVIVEEDGKGRICKWYYEMPMKVSDIPKTWPNAKIPEDLQKLIDKTPHKEKCVLIHCAKTGPLQYQFCGIWQPKQELLFSEDLRTSPFVTPRFYKVPGEKRGRGPAMLALPHIKTLNKTVEMQLKAAAFSILGAWMTTDDNLYNSKTSRLRPGGMLKVTRTGGPLGSSLERLPIPDNFDLTGIVLQELRTQVREIMFDDPLPDETGAVRSPTEIIARLRRLQQDITTAFGRLIYELFIPLVQRVLDILNQKGLLGEFIHIDQYVSQLQVLSPLAKSQALEGVENTLRFFEILVGTIGPEAALDVIDEDKLVVFLQESLGVRIDLMRPLDEVKARREQRQAVKDAMNAAQEAGINIPESVEQQALAA